MEKHLYSEPHGRFLRGLISNGSERVEDPTVDASLFGLFYFDCFSIADARVTSTIEAIVQKLSVAGGLARFENDDYMRAASDLVGNPWFICSLWLAEYYIECANTTADLEKPLSILRWITERALPSGVLAEQLDPRSGEPLSVSPLTWSHSTFVAAVHSYLDKRRTFA